MIIKIKKKTFKFKRIDYYDYKKKKTLKEVKICLKVI